MKTQFTSSLDGARIAYDVAGCGPALLLLHGAGKTRQHWHELGYVERLQSDFSVISVDLRGSGDSEIRVSSDDFAMEKLAADVCAVADACQAERFAVWGYSLGGMIARYLGARSERVGAAILHGAPFGPAVDTEFDRYIDEFIAKWGPLADAYQAGNLNPAQRKSALKGRMPVWVACFQAMRSWPEINPVDMGCPALLLAGSKNTSVMPWLQARRMELEDSNVTLELLDGFTHAQELSQVELFLPPAFAFLKRAWATPLSAC